jgi:hypothetical protein
MAIVASRRPGTLRTNRDHSNCLFSNRRTNLMSKATYPTSIVVTVHAFIGDVERAFASLDDAQAWLDDVQRRVRWMENAGLLALVNGHDRRWGRNGYEHMGWEREPGPRSPQSLRLVLRRAGNYLGKWLSMRDTPACRDGLERFPLDLTGRVRDLRPMQRAPWPHRAERTPGNVIIPPSWKVGPDGYYYHREPDLLLHAGFQHWEPACVEGQPRFATAANAEPVQGA